MHRVQSKGKTTVGRRKRENMCAYQEDGVPEAEAAVLGLRLVTKSITADQYPGWTHVSSAHPAK